MCRGQGAAALESGLTPRLGCQRGSTVASALGTVINQQYILFFMAVPERQHMHLRAGHNSAFLGFLRVRLSSVLKGSPETGGLNAGN